MDQAGREATIKNVAEHMRPVARISKKELLRTSTNLILNSEMVLQELLVSLQLNQKFDLKLN
jgi:hypothetical protein